MDGARAILFALLFVAAPAFASNFDTRLWTAASAGDVEGVKAALQDGADADYAQPDEHTRLSALHVAAMEGHADVVALLIQRGANVNIADADGDTPVVMAVNFDKKNVVEVLVANGADVRRADKNGCTPLLSAAVQGDLEIVSMLVERGAEVNAVDCYKQTPLDRAANAPTADFLLVHGARIGGVSADGETPLGNVDRELFMAAIAGDARRVRAAVGQGAHVNVHDNLGQTALTRAVYLGRQEAASALLAMGADVEETDFNGVTPLHVAAIHGFPKIIELLLAHGAKINAKDHGGETPLRWVRDGETAKVLLRAGAEANDPETLCRAASSGDMKLVELLLSYGADANPKTKCIGNTPLLSAITSRKWDIVPILLDHGADPNATGNSQFTPLFMAADAGSADTVASLLARGAKIDAPTKDGDTPLIDAARYGRKEVVRLLLDKGAKVGTKGKGGVTALAAAKDIETADLLISHGANVADIIPVFFGKDAKLGDRQEALFKAVVAGNVKEVAAASSRLGGVNYRYADGYTVLQTAVMLGRPDVVDWLLDQGADANTTNADSEAPLHMAVIAATADPQRQIHIMQSLLKYGAAIDPVDKNGMTPLHLAAATYNKDIVDFLLRNGADPLRRTKDGFTPLQFSQRSAFGTGLFGIATQGDVKQKSATIDVLRAAVRGQPLPQ